MGRESHVRKYRREAKLPRLRWITRGGIVYARKASNYDTYVIGRPGTRLAHTNHPRGTLFTGDLVSVVHAGRVVRTSIEAFDRYVGTPCTPSLEKQGRGPVYSNNENIRWARGHVDEDGAAALLAASALSSNSIADISGVQDWTFRTISLSTDD